MNGGRENPDEKALLVLVRQGDERAFEMLVHRYKRPIAKNMLRFLKSVELTEEALQDLFMKLWINRAQIDPEQPLKPYLFRIAENLIYDVFRKAARDQKLQTHLQQQHTEIFFHVEEQLMARETNELIQRVIDQLPPQRRRVYVLCKLEGLSYQEVAAELGISTATVNDHIRKANLFLRANFSLQHLSSPLLVGEKKF